MKYKKHYLVMSLVFLFSCTFNEPQLPEWDTSWTIHMPTKNFRMEEIINDSTIIAGVDGQGRPILLLNLQDSTEWERISRTDLALEPQDDKFNAEIGDIDLGDYDDLVSDSLRVIDILPPEMLSLGDTLPPYDTMTVMPPSVNLEYDDYKRACIKEGLLWLTFHNKMFLDIREGMVIKIFNENGELEYLDQVRFTEPIPAGAIAMSNPIDLAGKTIFNKFRLQYIIPLASSDTIQVLTNERRNSLIYTVLSVNQFIVTEAEAKIPAQSFDEADSIDITDQKHQITHALVEEGKIHFQIRNRLPLDTNIELELPNFIKNDQARVINHKLNAYQNEVLSVDLSGYEIINYAHPGNFVESIDYFALATVDSSADFVLINSKDSVSIDVETDSFFVSFFEGELDTIDFDIESMAIENLDFFEDIEGQVRLNDLVMKLDFQNEINLPLVVELKISGYNRDKVSNMVKDSVVIFVQEQILPSGISPVTTLILDHNYSTPSIVDLLEILPNQIEIIGNAIVYGQGSASIDDGIRAIYRIESPFNFEITNPLYYNTVIDSLTNDDIAEKERDQIAEDLTEVRAEFEFINHVPLGLNAKYYLAADSMMLFNELIPDSSEKIIFEAQIEPAIKDEDGYNLSPRQSGFSFQLSDRQLDIFKFSPIYTRQEIIIPPTDGPVRIKLDDELIIEAVLKVQTIVNAAKERN